LPLVAIEQRVLGPGAVFHLPECNGLHHASTRV
jgi:hypothetical protein